MTKKFAGTAALCAIFITACSGHETRRYDASAVRPKTTPDHVVILMSDPAKPFTKLGAVSVKKYKPGFSDPTVIDAEEQLKEAGADLGADAVIVRNSRSTGSRVVDVEGEAIAYANN